MGAEGAGEPISDLECALELVEFRFEGEGSVASLGRRSLRGRAEGEGEGGGGGGGFIMIM